MRTALRLKFPGNREKYRDLGGGRGNSPKEKRRTHVCAAHFVSLGPGRQLVVAGNHKGLIREITGTEQGNLSSANLSRVKFYGANLGDANFCSSTLANANLSDAKLRKARLPWRAGRAANAGCRHGGDSASSADLAPLANPRPIATEISMARRLCPMVRRNPGGGFLYRAW